MKGLFQHLVEECRFIVHHCSLFEVLQKHPVTQRLPSLACHAELFGFLKQNDRALDWVFATARGDG